MSSPKKRSLSCKSCMWCGYHAGALWCEKFGHQADERCDEFVYEPGTDEHVNEENDHG